MRKEKIREIQITIATMPYSSLLANKKEIREIINVYQLSEKLFRDTYPRCDYSLDELRFYYNLLNKQIRLLKSLND